MSSFQRQFEEWQKKKQQKAKGKGKLKKAKGESPTVRELMDKYFGDRKA